MAIFFSSQTDSAYHCVSAASCTVRCWRVEMTEMSRAAGTPCPIVEGKHRLDDIGDLGSKKESLSVVLKQQIELQRKLRHGSSHVRKFCHRYHHTQRDGHHIGLQIHGRWST